MYNIDVTINFLLNFLEEGKMDTKTTSILAYITVIGLIVALVAGDKEGAKFHINQAFVIWIAGFISGVVSVIPVIGWIAGFVFSIFLIVCWFIGLIAAINQEEKEIPLLGKISIIK